MLQKLVEELVYKKHSEISPGVPSKFSTGKPSDIRIVMSKRSQTQIWYEIALGISMKVLEVPPEILPLLCSMIQVGAPPKIPAGILLEIPSGLPIGIEYFFQKFLRHLL